MVSGNMHYAPQTFNHYWMSTEVLKLNKGKHWKVIVIFINWGTGDSIALVLWSNETNKIPTIRYDVNAVDSSKAPFENTN